MAILGVLLGIALSALVALFLVGRHRSAKLDDLTQKVLDEIAKTEARVSLLEKRKALLAETVTNQPKPAGVGAAKLRTWNEDAAPAEPAPHRSGYEVKHG